MPPGPTLPPPHQLLNLHYGDHSCQCQPGPQGDSRHGCLCALFLFIMWHLPALRIPLFLTQVLDIGGPRHPAPGFCPVPQAAASKFSSGFSISRGNLNIPEFGVLCFLFFGFFYIYSQKISSTLCTLMCKVTYLLWINYLSFILRHVCVYNTSSYLCPKRHYPNFSLGSQNRQMF